MQVVGGGLVVTTGAVRRAKLQSNHHHQQTNTKCFTGRILFLSRNQQCQSTEEKNITFQGLAHPSSPEFSNFVFDHERLLVTLRGGCHASHQLLMPAPQ